MLLQELQRLECRAKRDAPWPWRRNRSHTVSCDTKGQVRHSLFNRLDGHLAGSRNDARGAGEDAIDVKGHSEVAGGASRRPHGSRRGHIAFFLFKFFVNCFVQFLCIFLSLSLSLSSPPLKSLSLESLSSPSRLRWRHRGSHPLGNHTLAVGEKSTSCQGRAPVSLAKCHCWYHPI